MHLAVETGSREGGVRAMRDVWQQRQQRWVTDQTGGVSGCCFFSPLPTSLFRKWLADFTIWSVEHDCEHNTKAIPMFRVDSSVGRALDPSARHSTGAGLVPRCSKGFFTASQLSVQTVLQCLHNPYVPLGALRRLMSARMSESPNSGSHTLTVWTHNNCTHR